MVYYIDEYGAPSRTRWLNLILGSLSPTFLQSSVGSPKSFRMPVTKNTVARRSRLPSSPHQFLSGRALLVDIVLGFQALQQAFELRLVRVRRCAEGLRHLFRGRWEVALVRVDARQRHVADPVVRILLGNLGIQLERALGVSLPLEGAGIDVKL